MAVVRACSYAPAGVLSYVAGSERAAIVDESLVVSVPEAAVLLGVSEGLIYQLLDKGLLPELPRWSRRRLIPRRAVEVVIERTMADYNPEDVLRATLS
jgi:excisionase family DNA binding protein